MDPALQQRLRTHLGQKGIAVNAELTALLSKQNTTLATLKLPQERKPGMTRIERLQLFLTHISDAQKRLGTEAWGRCATCGGPISEAVLIETPWQSHCASCPDD